MILQETKSIDIDSDVEGLEGSVSTKDTPFMFHILSKAYYSRPIDSIVRELTSNCFDANVELGVKNPVIIERRYDIENDNYNIVFKDTGIGMNPDRIMNIYTKWLTSTKRESNDYIGSFGLGSKSPFSYNDSFYVTTISDGLKYEYVNALTPKHKLISLYGYNEEVQEITTTNEDGVDITEVKMVKIPVGIPTTECSGTEIIIPLINKKDYSLFEESIKKELCYFDDVFVLGFPDINNVYSIYRKETFMYRPNGGYSDNMHIILGKCCYPIDWEAIKRKPINIPVGIRFEIGELQVIPNRESIVYDSTDDDSICKLINSKIDEVLIEINALLSNGGDIRETDDLLYYLNNRKKKPRLWFDEHVINIPIEYVVDKRPLQFTPLKHLPITIPDAPFFYYRNIGIINGEKYETCNNSRSVHFSDDYILLDGNINKYTNANIGYGKAIKKSNLKKDYKELLNQLGLYVYEKTYRSQYSIGNNGDTHYDYIQNKDDNQWRRQPITIGKAKILKEYIDVMDREFKKNYITYSSKTPTDEWIANYKLELKEKSNAYLKKLNGEVTITTINGYRDVIKLVDLAKYENVIYFITSKNNKTSELATRCYNNLSYIKSLNKTEFKKGGRAYSRTAYHEKQFKFVGIAQSNLNTLRKLENLVHINEFKHLEIFKKYDQLIADLRHLETIDYIDYRNFIKYDKVLELRELKKIITDKVNSDYKPIDNTILPSQEVVKYVNDFKKELEKIEILKYVDVWMPNKFLIPISSKLKSRYIKKELLGLNPQKEQVVIIKQNQMLF